MTDKMSISFTSAVVPVKPVNDQFTLCKCYVMALGKNQNKSNISKAAADDAMPSLFNIPVVGHIFTDKDGETRMGGHDSEIVKGEDGKHKFKVMTQPYGVVPQQDNVHYEDIEEEDGTVNTYLVADVILWTGRYPELLDVKYDENTYFSESMEIRPSQVTKEDGYTNIEKYQYSALCLLGRSDNPRKNVEPCFEQSRVDVYEFSTDEECAQLFEEFRNELAKCYSQQCVGEGGNKALNTETIKQILLEFGLAEDTVLSFEVAEDMTEDMLREKIKEVYFAESANDEAEDNPVDENPPEDTDETTTEGELALAPEEPQSVLFSIDLTAKERLDKIEAALCGLNVWTEDEYVGYRLMDFSDEFVYCDFVHCKLGEADEHYAVRIPYAIDGDNLSLDLTKEEKVRSVWLTAEEEAQIEQKDKDLEELKAYKAQRLEDDRRKEYAAVIADFQDLSETDEYKEVVKDAMSFENATALTERLFAIRGRYSKAPTKKPLSAIRIPVGFEAKKSISEMEEFMNTYLPRKN